VENIRDVISVENTHQYDGLYHVLGGIISPMDGIAPSDLEIDSLVDRVEKDEIREIILALPTTMEGDTTNFYIFRRLKDTGVRVTTLARGISVGDDLEYTDEITLGKSILNRVDFESSLGK
jgi:recombination protein RecR